MADVNERMREREGERRMWITFRLPLVPAFSWGDVCKITCSYEVDWRWLWNWMRGWETASSVRCLWRRLLSAANPSLPLAPPQRPEIKTDKNISSHFRTSRSLTLISLPWAFLLKTLSPHSPALFSLSLLFMSFFISPFHLSPYISASLLDLSVFCPHWEALEGCLEGVMCGESDLDDHWPQGSGHLLAGANSFIPAPPAGPLDLGPQPVP